MKQHINNECFEQQQATALLIGEVEEDIRHLKIGTVIEEEEDEDLFSRKGKKLLWGKETWGPNLQQQPQQQQFSQYNSAFPTRKFQQPLVVQHKSPMVPPVTQQKSPTTPPPHSLQQQQTINYAIPTDGILPGS